MAAGTYTITEGTAANYVHSGQNVGTTGGTAGQHTITTTLANNSNSLNNYFFEASSPTGSTQHSQITTNFNANALSAGQFLWFNSAMTATGITSAGATIRFSNVTVQFTANSKTYSLAVPDATVIFDPTATAATTTFNALSNSWVTKVPVTSFSGDIFLDALAFQVPTGGLPSGIKNVTWSGDFFASKSGIKVTWQWAAARYSSSFAGSTVDYNSLGVKPVDNSTLSSYKNSDSTGVPESKKSTHVGPATGTVNYTGSYTATTVVSNPTPLLAAGATSTSTDIPLGTVASGVYLVSVDGLRGDLGTAEQARIDDALAELNGELGKLGVALIEVSPGNSAAATIHIHLASAGAMGGAADGVLGDTDGNDITLIDSWSYYVGADAGAIGANQYDFQTVVTHEIGHSLGLGHSSDPSSVMYPYLSTGQVRRDLSTSDMNSIMLAQGGVSSAKPVADSMVDFTTAAKIAWAGLPLSADAVGCSTTDATVRTTSANFGGIGAVDGAARDLIFSDFGVEPRCNFQD